MLNVRMSAQLKEHAGQVLRAEGISTSDAVRGLFRVIESTQEVPSCIREKLGDSRRRDVDRKRSLVRSWVGAAPEMGDIDFKQLRHERLDRKFASGVRE